MDRSTLVLLLIGILINISIFGCVISSLLRDILSNTKNIIRQNEEMIRQNDEVLYVAKQRG